MVCLKDHRLRGVLPEDVANWDDEAAVEPHLDHLTVAAKHLDQLLVENAIILLSLRSRFTLPGGPGTEMVVARADINTSK